MAPVLSVENLTTELASGAGTILEDVNFTVAPGEVLGIVGESGSGKSMLALTIMGLLPRAIRRKAGTIRLAGEDLTAIGADAWRQKRGRDLAMIFQEPMTSLNPVMRVGAQIGEVLRLRRGLDARAAEAEALRLLERVEIPAAAKRIAAYPHELSGGMRQRVMIAVALAARPKLLIADEPTTALDVTIQAQVLDLLRQLQREDGLGLILITHDLGVIAEMAERVLVLYAGRVAETAPARALFDRPAHPYSAALMASIPRTTGPRGRLASIEGTVPIPGAMPPGCRFAPRCPRRLPACTAAPPVPAPLTPGHDVACLSPVPATETAA